MSIYDNDKEAGKIIQLVLVPAGVGLGVLCAIGWLISKAVAFLTGN